MNNKEKDDLYYVCCLIEYIGRKTKNRRANIVKIIGKDELKRLLEVADVNHTLSFEQVSDEIIEYAGITEGDYDSVGDCIYDVPNFLFIGRNYQRLIIDVKKDDEEVVETLMKVFTSFVSDEISNFNSSVYYSSREYIKAIYEEGKMLG